MNDIKCPLLNKNIEDVICFDISMVAENMAPESTAPKEAIQVKGYKEICLNCPNHSND